MSNPRGRRDGTPYNNFPRPYRQPSWQNQLNYFQSDHVPHPNWGESQWTRPPYWDNGPQNNVAMVPWQRPCYSIQRPHHSFEDGPNQFESFPQRFPSNGFPQRSGPLYSERSLIQITQTSIDDTPKSGRTSRDGQRHPAQLGKQVSPNSSNPQMKSIRQGTGNSNASNCSATGSSPQASKNTDKASTSTPKSSGIKPPSDDLRNIVKESLKTMTRGGTSPAQSTTEDVPSPSRRVREARIPSGEQSHLRRPSGDASMRRPASEYNGSPGLTRTTPTETRRRVQSQSSCEASASSLLNGLGYIQRTPGEALPSPSQNQAGDEEPVTISREQLNRYIRSMDNQQRRQLVEQPRDSISKSLLDHLVQENQSNKARQLSSLRFRVTSTDIEATSRNESTVMLSEELVEQIKELLAQQDAEDALPSTQKPRSSQPDDDEIEIIEPPPKAPPICIDLDCDDQPPVNSRVLQEQTVPKNEASNEPADSFDKLMADISAICSDVNNPVAEATAQVTQSIDNDNINSRASTSSSVTESEQTAELADVQPSDESQIAINEASNNTEADCETNSQSVNSTCTTEPTSTSQEIGTASVTETEDGSIQTRSELAALPMENCPSELVESTNDVSTEQSAGDARLETLPSDAPLEEASETTSNFLIESVTSLATPTAVPEQPSVPNEAPIAEHQSINSTNLRLTELASEERQDVTRLKEIDEMIEALNNERKTITDRLLVRKQQQFDILRSSWAKHFNVPVSAATSNTPQSSILSTTPSVGVSEPTTSATALDRSAELLGLKLQLEQNGLQVVAVERNCGDKFAKVLSSKKRKRAKTVPVGYDSNAATSNEPKITNNTSTPSKNKISAAPSPVGFGKKKRKKTASNSFEVSPIPQTNGKASKNKKKKSLSNQAVKSSAGTAAQTDAISQSHNGHHVPSNTPPIIANPEPIAQTSNAQPLSNQNEPQPSAPTLPTARGSACGTHLNNAQPVPASDPKPKEVPSTTTTKRPHEVERTQRTEPSDPKPNQSKSKEVPPTQAAKRPHEAERTQIPEPSDPAPPETPKDPKIPRSSEPDQPEIVAQLVNDVGPFDAQASGSSDSSDSMLYSSVGGGMLEPHVTAVKTMFVNGPCLFTASEDGTVHVYDLASGVLSMRILGHQDPVTFLYAVSLRKTTAQLKNCLSTGEYLNNLNLITGSLDGFVRQFSLETGNVLHEIDCHTPVTCAAPNKRSQKLYVGTKSGAVFAFDPKTNDLRPARFKAHSEVILMKALATKTKKLLVLCSIGKNIMVYDCATEERLFSLSTGVQNNYIQCVTSAGNMLYCCDANKRVFTFDMLNDKTLLRTDELPSAAVSCFHYSNRYLFFACQDGVIRVIDTTKKTKNVTSVAGPHPKTLSCMRLSDSKIICGSLAGEVFYRAIPRFAFGAPGTGK